jgi:hypothetical protein
VWIRAPTPETEGISELTGYAYDLVWVIVSAIDIPRLITWVWCNIIYIYGYGVSEIILNIFFAG